MNVESVPGDKILVIDDDPLTCRLLQMGLEMEGYACVTLSDPESILEAVRQESPAMVLLDFHLGIQSGLDLLQTIRACEEHKNLPVVVMSAMDCRRQSRLAGADGFVLKPFDWEAMATTIQEILGRKQGD